MTNQLIPTVTGILNGHQQPMVEARTLHSFLGSGQNFTDWIDKRLDSYEFVLNEDFLLHKVMKQSGRGGSNRIDFLLSMDTAKELCMIENTKRGRQARRYFIEMEREAKQGLINQSQLVKALLDAKPEIAILKRYVEMGLSSVEMGKLMDKHPDTIRRALHKYSKIGVISWQPNQKYAALSKLGNAKIAHNQLALTLEA